MQEATTEERLEFLTTLLQRRRAYLASAVLRLGKLRFSGMVETAAIYASGEHVALYFNPNFFEAIDILELAGVLVHEALHFALRHQLRAETIRRQSERFLFNLAADAVINDLITKCYPELKLPGKPITGLCLIGEDASQMSAEQVFQRLRSMQQGTGRSSDSGWHLLETVDDHSFWGSDEQPQEDSHTQPPAVGWSEASSSVACRLLEEWGTKDAAWGTEPLGAARLVRQSRRRKNLARFLIDSMTSQRRCETRWAPPARKLSAFYPKVILPSYDAVSHWNVLIAIDASGSVPNDFLSVALALARQRIQRTKITLISFDAKTYQVLPSMCQVRGGGGTRVQAVEEFAQTQMSRYPDQVFVMTDGLTSPPKLSQPKRWLWILPPWGSTRAIPKGCRTEFFEYYAPL